MKTFRQTLTIPARATRPFLWARLHGSYLRGWIFQGIQAGRRAAPRISNALRMVDAPRRIARQPTGFAQATAWKRVLVVAQAVFARTTEINRVAGCTRVSAFTGCLPRGIAGESLRDTPAYQSARSMRFVPRRILPGFAGESLRDTPAYKMPLHHGSARVSVQTRIRDP